MKTDVITISPSGEGMAEALRQTEKAAAYQGLTPKESMRLRLLGEEMMGMLRTIVGEGRSSFWVEAEGKDFGYTGDTNTLPALADSYRGCDLLLADGLFPEEKWAESLPHLSAALAAELARDAGVGRLVLTHLHPAHAPGLLLREARAVFREVSVAEAGAVLTL